MSKALALLALTVLSSVYAAEVPQPSWTNHNRIAGSQQMMTNFKPWAEAVESTLGDKRNKTDNVCHKAEYSDEWVANLPLGHSFENNSKIEYGGENGWYVWLRIDGFGPSQATATGPEDAVSLDFRTTFGSTFTATRPTLCKSNDTFVTWSPMTNAVANLIKPALDDKRNKTDNVCHKTGFTEWEFSGSDYDPTATYEMEFIALVSERTWYLWKNGSVYAMADSANEDDTFIDTFRAMTGVVQQVGITATRSPICASNDTFVTWTPMTNAVAYLVETKANKPTTVTPGHFASLDSDGNLLDSGYNKTYFIERDLNDHSDISFPEGKRIYFDGARHTAGWEPGQGFYTKSGGMMLFEWSDYAVGFDYPQTLPEYLASGDWNTSSDPFVKTSEISATNMVFSNAVLAVQISTNDFAALYELKNAFAELPIDPVTGGISIGSLLAALASAVVWLKKNKVQTLKLEGNSVEASADGGVAKLDAFFTKSNGLLTGTIDDRLPIPISAKSAGFTTESYKRFIVTVSGDMTVTLHTPTSGDAEIFECRFNGASLSADASITFAGATATTMDANCGTVTAGKVALMSAFWNGSTWDVNWKVEG